MSRPEGWSRPPGHAKAVVDHLSAWSRTVRPILIVVGSAAYLGLAILGWGGFAAFFAHPALIALALVFVALAGAALVAGGNLSPGVREDRANRWVIPAIGLIGLLAACRPCSATASAAWSRSSSTTRWSPPASTA